MTIDTLIMLSGAFIALLPFLGIPARWDTVFMVIVGVVVVILGIMVRRGLPEDADTESQRSQETFFE